MYIVIIMLGNIYSDPIHRGLGIFALNFGGFRIKEVQESCPSKMPRTCRFWKGQGLSIWFFFVWVSFFTDWMPWDSSPFLNKNHLGEYCWNFFRCIKVAWNSMVVWIGWWTKSLPKKWVGKSLNIHPSIEKNWLWLEFHEQIQAKWGLPNAVKMSTDPAILAIEKTPGRQKTQRGPGNSLWPFWDG